VRTAEALEQAKAMVRKARWRAADDLMTTIERDHSCAMDRRRLLVKLGLLRREEFQPLEAKRLYEEALAVDGTPILARVAAGQLESLMGMRGDDLPFATRVANVICWDWLKIDHGSLHGSLIEVSVWAACRKAWLAGALLVLSAVWVWVRSRRDPMEQAPTMTMAIGAVGPLLLFWILFLVVPMAAAVAMYAAKIPLPTNPIVMTELLPYGICALTFLLVAGRASASRSAPTKRIVILGVFAGAMSIIVFCLARHRPDSWFGDPVDHPGAAALLVLSLPLGAYVEEFVFRDRLWARSRSSLGLVSAAALSSAVFAISHDRSWAATGVIFLLSESFRVSYERLGGLRGAAMVHWITNLVLICIQLSGRGAEGFLT
jgi:membrane protease YdiL (CAAX protease family)